MEVRDLTSLNEPAALCVDVRYALSLRQPWAALLADGCKSIEIRRWRTARRGWVLIHAARAMDRRPEAWERLPSRLWRAARLRGGIVGVGRIENCLAYRSRETFADDEDRHLNPPNWFRDPVLYGLIFRQATPLPFRPLSGWVRFFPVGSFPDPTEELPLFRQLDNAVRGDSCPSSW